MLKANVRLDWTPSSSSDVVSQKLTTIVDGTETLNTLDRLAATFIFKVPENGQVGVSLVANDGTFDSDAATLSFNIGDLGVPLAPTGLGFTIVDVVDEE